MKCGDCKRGGKKIALRKRRKKLKKDSE